MATWVYLMEPQDTNNISRRSRKAPKRPPQRGLGVAQLERLRLQHHQNQHQHQSTLESTINNVIPPQHLHIHHQNISPPTFPSSVTTSTNPLVGRVPIQYDATAPSYGEPLSVNGTVLGFPDHNQMRGKRGWCSTGLLGSGSCSGVGGLPLMNRVKNFEKPTEVGTPVMPWIPVGETSRELSSIPKVDSIPERCEICCKKKRFNVVREDPSENFPLKNCNLLDSSPQQIPISDIIGEPTNFSARRVTQTPPLCDLTHNEPVEIVAIHKVGNSILGRNLFMEYELFPGKYETGASSKEIEFPIKEASVGMPGGEASPITATANTDSASNPIDLSLKLSY